MIKRLLVLTALIFFSAVLGHAENKIILATLDWEPYIGQDLKNQGYVAEIIREAYKRSGYEVKIKFTPWARTVNLSKTGQVDGYFPEYFADEVKSHALFSDPFQGGPIGFFKRKDNKISFQTLQDLKPYKIGVVRDYVNTKEFDDADYLVKEAVNNDLTNLRKLIGRRIDLTIGDKFVDVNASVWSSN